MPNCFDKLPATGTLTAGDGLVLNVAGLKLRVSRIRDALLARRRPRAPVAILADNSPDWIAVDLATQELGISLVPLPLFFTPAQWAHAIDASGVQSIFCAQPAPALALGFTVGIPCDSTLALFEAERGKAGAALEGIQKITFTSGTTAEPKGVCLSADQQWDVAQALHAGLAGRGGRRHLCLLPLAVLLENIAGVYTALLSGAATLCPPLAETGLSGASGFDPQVCLAAIRRHRAESIILLPQMLQALTAASAPNDERIRSLKFIAVGGAKTPAALISAARAKGFPVFEGYGLSECGSVVSLNLPGADRPGSVGRPLANRKLRIAADGEIEVGGPRVAHYLGALPDPRAWLPTGDLGRLDDAGFLYIDGRKKNLLITAYGRNVSPEWPESVLLGTGLFAQVIVFGDARPWLAAAVVPAAPRCSPAAVQRAIDQANRELPDYARIQRWFAVDAFTPLNGLATANGRPRRDAIRQRYRQQIGSLYGE